MNKFNITNRIKKLSILKPSAFIAQQNRQPRSIPTYPKLRTLPTFTQHLRSSPASVSCRAPSPRCRPIDRSSQESRIPGESQPSRDFLRHSGSGGPRPRGRGDGSPAASPGPRFPGRGSLSADDAGDTRSPAREPVHENNSPPPPALAGASGPPRFPRAGAAPGGLK